MGTEEEAQTRAEGAARHDTAEQVPGGTLQVSPAKESGWNASATVAFPAILTSEAPNLPSRRAEGARDLGWLQGLNPPELPVRWDDRLVAILEQYRTTPQGQATIRAFWPVTLIFGHASFIIRAP